MRKPIAYGFYPKEKTELIKTIENCFLDNYGPGELPKERKNNKNLIAGIVPHAGYVYSGPCAAWLYKELYENWNFDTIVIIGTNHSGLGYPVSLFITEDWETPLGIVKVDKDFGKKIIQSYDAVEDSIPHLYEHSIEVQLPFLQYISKEFKIVPILIKDLNIEEIREFMSLIDEIAKELKRRIFLLASSDFTHHGKIYGYIKFSKNIIENVKKLDLEYIEKILNLDSEGFLELIEENNGTVCGIYPILSFIEYSKLKKAKTHLLKYYNSGEKTKEEDIVVGYASIISFI